MDNEERVLTEVVRELIRIGVVAFTAYTAGGTLEPVLGPEAGLIVTAASSLIVALSERNYTWADLCSIRAWNEITTVIFRVATNLFLQNCGLFVRVALRIARFIQQLFNRNNQADVSFDRNSALERKD